MGKEKFHIPFPDEDTIRNQINQIVSTSVKSKESFFTYLKSMYQQVGIKHLFSDRSELTFILITAITLLILFFIRPDPSTAQMDDLYAFIFLISPVLFIVLSIYTYTNKIMNATYEVEMVCKYNVFQIIAFRMLVFSVITILVNSLTIFFIVRVYDYIQFFRAFMISTSGLFIFSIVFLYILMKRRTKVVATIMIFAWLIGNLLLRFMNNKLYSDILVNIPLFIYGIIIIISIFIYINFLKRLIHYKQSEELL